MDDDLVVNTKDDSHFWEDNASKQIRVDNRPYPIPNIESVIKTSPGQHFETGKKITLPGRRKNALQSTTELPRFEVTVFLSQDGI